MTENAHKNGIWVGICGELGADLTLTETFLAFGVDELSVTPRSVLPLRNAVRMTDTRESSEPGFCLTLIRIIRHDKTTKSKETV